MSILGQRPRFEKVSRFSLIDSRLKSVRTPKVSSHYEVIIRIAYRLIFD